VTSADLFSICVSPATTPQHAVDYPFYISSAYWPFVFKKTSAFDPSLLSKGMTTPVQIFKRHAPLIMVPFTPFDISEALTTLLSAERTAFMFAAD
jgi:hypothetical protein